MGVPAGQGATIVDALIANGHLHPDRPAMRYRTVEHRDDWEVVTWSQYLIAARQVAGGLAELGVEPGDRIAILAANRIEWHLADAGILANGSVTVPVYPTSSSSQVAYILGHSGVRVCFVDSHSQLGKVLEIRDQLPKLERVVLVDGAQRSGDTFVVNFDDLRANGADRIERDPELIDHRSSEVKPEDLATVVYTSGTTGPPKGAMISHGNIMWTLRNVTPVYGIGKGDRLLSFLPLSHIAERMMSDFMPIAVTGETWFARSLATVAEDLPSCRPTVFLAVPRVWEKLREGIEGHLRHQPMAVRLAVERYVALGLHKVAADQDGVAMAKSAVTLYSALNKTLGATIREQLGLDQTRVLITAAAPIHPDLIRWFHAIGLPLLQLYGQTEGCGPTTANPPDDVRIGTVGSALPGMMVRLAGDGEILLKGDNVCLGYLDDAAATADLIDPDGWMHTGDTGTFDTNGFLRIVGRKKDLIITAAGKNIAPQGIETDLCNHPLISEAIVVGEARKFLAALITLDPEELTHWADRHNKLAEAEALGDDADLLAEIDAVVDEVNAKRSHAEGIRKFRLLAHDLTAAAGELTPTMKVKRAVVYEHYQDEIEDLYAGS